MIRLLRKRPLFALAALAGFVLSGVSEARALDPCLHHDSLPGELAPETQGGGQGSHAAHTAHAEHSVASGEATADLHGHGPSHSSEDGSASHEGCSCVGHCDAGTSSPVPAAACVALRIDPSPRFVRVPSAEELLSHKSGGLWLLHLATAPPLSV
jgi:hypothetical protein